MKRMTTAKNHERRITALETRTNKIDEVLASHSESLYVLKRIVVRNELRMGKVMKRLDLEDISEDEVDEVLDAE